MARAIMYMSVQTYRLVKNNFAFMYTDETGLNLLIEPKPEMYVDFDGVGYLIVDGVYHGCYKLEVGDGKISGSKDPKRNAGPSGLPH